MGGWTGGGRADGTQNGGERANERTRRGQGGLSIGRTGGQAGVLKGPAPRPHFTIKRPDYLPHCRVSLQGAWECTGVLAGFMLFFFLLQTAYLQFRHSTILKCVPELF